MVAANPTKGAPVTGPEHYHKAEQLLEEAEAADAEGGWRPVRQIQLASVHATLAPAAGAALGTSPSEGRAWADVGGPGLAAAERSPVRAINRAPGRTEASAEVISKPLVSSPAAWADGPPGGVKRFRHVGRGDGDRHDHADVIPAADLALDLRGDHIGTSCPGPGRGEWPGPGQLMQRQDSGDHIAGPRKMSTSPAASGWRRGSECSAGHPAWCAQVRLLAAGRNFGSPRPSRVSGDPAVHKVAGEGYLKASGTPVPTGAPSMRRE
jgi:hypothetical protein